MSSLLTNLISQKPVMTPNSSKAAFAQFLLSAGFTLKKLTARAGIELMMDFYREVPARGCDGTDADMLLFQWGQREQVGSQPRFFLDITRQFMLEEPEREEDAYTMSTLTLTFFYPLQTETKAMGIGNEWCEDPERMREFKEFLKENEPFQILADIEPLAVTLEFGGI
jgi:hypothetical protein